MSVVWVAKTGLRWRFNGAPVHLHGPNATQVVPGGSREAALYFKRLSQYSGGTLSRSTSEVPHPYKWAVS